MGAQPGAEVEAERGARGVHSILGEPPARGSEGERCCFPPPRSLSLSLVPGPPGHLASPAGEAAGWAPLVLLAFWRGANVALGGPPRPFLHPGNRNTGVLGARRTISLPQGGAGQPRCRPDGGRRLGRGVSHTGGACPGASALPGLCCCCRSLPLFAGFLLVKPWATRGERSPRQAALRGCGWVPAARSCPRSAPRARLSPARPRVLLSPSRARRDRGFAASPSPAHAGVPARKRRQRHHASPNAPRAPLWVWVVWGVPSSLLPAIVPEILFPGSQ